MTRRILIIEDTPTIARVQKHIAQKVGYEADIAGSLAEAKELISKHSFFCAVVDFILPDAPNGEAVPCTIEADIPTIVMTGNLDETTRNIVEKHPIIDYITKENKQAYQYLEKQLARLPRNEQILVLVVDDSAATRHHICNLLTRHKYQTLEAVDGVDALKVLAENPKISVIITDNEMPNMNGDELCVEIRRLYSNDEKAIIGISALDTLHLSTRFLKSGADDYLRKPFNNEEFYCRLSQNVDMLENIKTIRLQANTDYLTKLPNRRYFFGEANSHLKAAKVSDTSVSLAMIDVDHFKSINDNYGHDAGDDVLKGLSQCMAKYFEDNLVGRFGGEEFAVYFADQDPQESLQRLEKFRLFVEKHSPEFSKDHIKFTLSIGFHNGPVYSLDELIKQADLKLYQAKDTGRNKLVS
ncbi:diguanylate cyclase [Pseudoalteromonas shioyasakiensis]|uniref:diguanylate cyclase n=1 Tax=Pseudoalteromonas shioyasakiensis TaxID=1190813 RepID=A0ABT6U5K3_9GAMM|nr:MULTISPECIES: diguanylate cyclase [Pseudoalteromonas]NUJ32506.1 diguanylate cyclase [Pseudoalteromonas sp. 2103]MDI4671441.1 diguanylate cyclase [Pseudoalteromonas shioyasakiensis]MDI4673308.1 diguanylate cyclase [Pseudoalteromonas shioyasakiensis]MDI4688325.1 diguanylate cyclase [Pseudoalteromonas shioyasakiensis]MDI4706946.1 diguanylate cyclase [Pseudoalteromonas shioyasakiensis]